MPTGVSSHGLLCRWKRVSVTFANLFKKILAEAHHRLTVEEELSHSCLEMVFVGQSKESLSEVDDKLPCSG